MWRPMLCQHGLPVGLAHHAIADAAEHETAATMVQLDAFVSERSNADCGEIVAQLGLIAAKIVVVAETKPSAEARPAQSRKPFENRNRFVGVTGYQITADDDEVRLGMH